MAEALIDVIIPVYNGAKTVESAIASIQAQSVREIQIIVVDDGSDDETPAILQRIGAADARVQVIRQANAGIVDALNAGLSACRAELVARHDADDLAYPDRFSAQLAYLNDHPDCVAVSGAVKQIDEHGRRLETVGLPGPPENADPDWVPSIEPYLMHPFLMVRRRAMEAVGGYRYVEHAEDTDLYWRLRQVGRLHNMDQVLGDYRLHSGSISGRSVATGRVQAMTAQLAAISAKRRDRNEPDLSFPKQRDRYRAASTLNEILAIGHQGLTRPESDYLQIALAGKMLELSSYRPYEIELEDCRFIRSALDRHMAIARPENRKSLSRQCAGTAARLIQKGRFREGFALVSRAEYAGTAARVAARMAMPATLKAVLRKSLGLGGHVK